MCRQLSEPVWEQQGTDQQVQAVQVGLDVVGVFRGHAPELLQFRTSCLPYNHGKGNHPLDALLYVTPLIPCGGNRQAQSEADERAVGLTHLRTHLKPFASVRMKRSGTRQKQQGHRRKILGSRHPGRRGPRATEEKRTLKPAAAARPCGATRPGGAAGPRWRPLASAICVKICCGYCGSSTSYTSFR